MIHWGLKTQNDQSVQETEQYLYCFFISDPRPGPTILSTFTTAGAARVSSSSCFTADHRRISALAWHYLSNGPLTLYLQYQWSRVSFGFVCIRFFFSLKAVSPIDCHYMTDRLQRFEIKIFVCVLLKKKSPTYWMPRGIFIIDEPSL